MREAKPEISGIIYTPLSLEEGGQKGSSVADLGPEQLEQGSWGTLNPKLRPSTYSK